MRILIFIYIRARRGSSGSKTGWFVKIDPPASSWFWIQIWLFWEFRSWFVKFSMLWKVPSQSNFLNFLKNCWVYCACKDSNRYLNLWCPQKGLKNNLPVVPWKGWSDDHSDGKKTNPSEPRQLKLGFSAYKLQGRKLRLWPIDQKWFSA